MWLDDVIYVLCLILPFALSPLLVMGEKAARCAYVFLWVAVYWMFQPIHLAVTSLLPVVLFPVLDILTTNEVCSCYMQPAVMLFFGSLAVATAITHSGLHERAAVNVLYIVGSQTKWLLLGFMLTSMFLSMWISSAATAAMMMPIVSAIMQDLERGSDNAAPSSSSAESLISVPEAGPNRILMKIRKALLLGVAYSASCGGTGTITGAPPNIVFMELLGKLFPKCNDVNYITWMCYNIPGMLLCIFCGWIVLQVIYIPFWKKDDDEIRKNIADFMKRKREELGYIKFHEVAAMVLICVLVFLWVFQSPKFVPGWGDLLPSGRGKFSGATIPLIFIFFLMCLVPAKPKLWPHSPTVLSWEVVEKELPWGLVFLLGGGFALAAGSQESGLSKWFACKLMALSKVSVTAMLVIICIMTVGFTEIMSNAPVVTILIPVVAQLALWFRINPLYLMIPVTICSSYAFMLPIATGANALVYSTGCMSVTDMVKPGLLMNICACLIQVFMINTLGVLLFNLQAFPSWANETLVSAMHNTTLDVYEVYGIDVYDFFLN